MLSFLEEWINEQFPKA